MGQEQVQFLTRFIITLNERLSSYSWAELSGPERVVVLVDQVESEVNNGGFHQFYFNAAGDRAIETPAALREIGACQLAAIIDVANALFPGGTPPENRAERQRVLDEIDPAISTFRHLDDKFYAYPDDTLKLVYDFVIAHRDQVRGT